MNSLVTLFSELWAQRLGWVLIHFLWQGTAIALLLAAVLRLLAQASSHARYVMIGSAFILCAVLPLATWIILGPQASSSMTSSTVLNPTDLPNVESPVMRGSAPHTDGTIELQGNVQTCWQANLSRVADVSLPYVVGLWFVGILILTFRLTMGWMLMRRVCLSGIPIRDAFCLGRFRGLLKRMQVHVPVRLLESALIEVPTLIGWLRPTILVPASVFIGLTPDQLEAILAHELAHVRRYDYLVNLFQTVIETVLFYHPAVWWISRKLREERENCCDDIALEVMQDRLVYVSALAQLEEGRAIPLAMTASGGLLIQRIKRIVGANNRKVSAWPLCILIIGAISLVCLSQTKATETPNTQKQQGKTYLQVTYIKTADSSAMSWSRKMPNENAVLMLKNPKNEVTELNNFPLTDGINTLSGKTPWGADFTIILNWNDSPTSKPHDLALKMGWPHANGGDVSYGFKDKASLGRNDCFVVTGPWKTKETSNLLISFVDHPSRQPQKNDAGNTNAQVLETVDRSVASAPKGDPTALLNGLRHSYISYRLAVLHDTARVALEAGNSPEVIFAHYRELVTPEAAEAWFKVKPA